MFERLQQEHLLGYMGILFTILFTVYGQIVIKWQVSKIAYLLEKGRQVEYITKLLLNPWIVTSLIAAFLAFLSWTVAVSKLDLSYAYPFTVISFILVLGLSAVFFHEAITPLKVIGVALIVTGLIIGSKG